MRMIVHNPPPMSDQASLSPRAKAKKWLMFLLRWGIAVVGIWWVVSKITWRDRVIELGPHDWPREVRLAEMPDLNAAEFKTLDGRSVRRSELVNKADQATVVIRTSEGNRKVELLALKLSEDLKQVHRFLIKPSAEGAPEWKSPAQVVDYKLKVPHPLVEVGIGRMVRDAASGSKPWLLVLSVLIFPITYIVTSIRWHELLKALEIYLPLGRTFVINMVGAFYNTFMLGSTGGDVIKAYYASKQTRHRTRAVMSVFVDRVIGLLALIVMGGAMAAYQYFTGGGNDPASHACGKIAGVSLLVIVGTIVFLFVFYKPTLRRMSGLGWLLTKLPKQKQISNAVQTLEMYRKRKALVIGSLIATFPVHITVVVSAMLACKAFGLTLSPLYYFVAVPVIVLVGSIPISPQGAGVMEYFAVILVARQGGTISQAFAMTMSIRIVQMLWNLTGGIFVFRGGYHTLSELERRELDTDEDTPDAKAA